jgi:hypothetical protein
MAIKGLIKGLHRYFYTTVVIMSHAMQYAMQCAAAQTPGEPE